MNDKKLEMINLYKKYGYDFPLSAVYQKSDNVIPFSTDFEDGEQIEFWWNCDKPSSCAIGNAYYSNGKGKINLVNIKNLKEIK